MKKYILCGMLVLLGMFSCKNEAVPKPDNLLSKEKMAAILYDITLINSIKGVNKLKLEEAYMHLDSYLYNKHNIDSMQFVDSNSYYSTKPEVYHEIYGAVLSRLNAERKVVGAELEIEQKRKDSISEIKKAERKKKDSLDKLNPEKVKEVPKKRKKMLETDG